MSEKKYNLLDEKWICVMDSNGEMNLVSLKEAFADAHNIRALSGDTAPQDASILRLMIAILYCIYLREDVDGHTSEMDTEEDAINRWNDLWSRGSFNFEQISDYLERYRDSFYLFHPTNPFYQTVMNGGTPFSACKFNGSISESNNKPRLFTHAAGDRKELLSYPEATRWLVCAMSYDDCSAKRPTPKMSWMGRLGLVVVEGRNLFETILFNMPFTDAQHDPYPIEKAPWEEGFHKPEPNQEVPIPSSPIGILTLQSRNIILDCSDNMVSGVRIMAGAYVDNTNALVENMVCWKQKNGKLEPMLHDPSKSIWRDYQALLLGQTENGDKFRIPGTISWLTKLTEKTILPRITFRVMAIGIQYGSMNSSISEIIDDNIFINSELLSDLNRPWNKKVTEMVKLIERSVDVYGKFIHNLAELNGYKSNSSKAAKKKLSAIVEAAKETLYSKLDFPFRTWLSTINPGESDPDEKSNEWKDRLRQIVLDEGEAQMYSSTMNSRRSRKKDNSKKYDNVFFAYGEFRASINKSIGGKRK